MTDLERVREYFAGNPWVTDIIDTHLKEDAAREDKLMDAYTAMDERDAELARLREEVTMLRDKYEGMRDA